MDNKNKQNKKTKTNKPLKAVEHWPNCGGPYVDGNGVLRAKGVEITNVNSPYCTYEAISRKWAFTGKLAIYCYNESSGRALC